VPFEATPTTVDAHVRHLLLGAYTLPDRLLLSLDAAEGAGDGREPQRGLAATPATSHRTGHRFRRDTHAGARRRRLPRHAGDPHPAAGRPRFDVAQAGDGQEALEVLGGGVRPDVILVDWNMPVMDGLTFIKQCRAHDEYRDIVLMMVTDGERAGPDRAGPRGRRTRVRHQAVHRRRHRGEARPCWGWLPA
jgi:CheY-like chemotaxis protein